MDTFITIIYVIVALMMVLAILLQAGKGGGLGSALGGGASQSVFGGGGGGDFMAKLTQGFAATFMICAMYLAYASAHAGSDFLKDQKKSDPDTIDADQEIDFEQIGINPQPLPTPEEGKAMQAKAAALVPAQSEVDPAAEPAPEPAAEPAAIPAEDDDSAGEGRGDLPEGDRGDSPQAEGESLQNPSANDDKLGTEPSEAPPGE